MRLFRKKDSYTGWRQRASETLSEAQIAQIEWEVQEEIYNDKKIQMTFSRHLNNFETLFAFNFIGAFLNFSIYVSEIGGALNLILGFIGFGLCFMCGYQGVGCKEYIRPSKTDKWGFQNGE